MIFFSSIYMTHLFVGWTPPLFTPELWSHTESLLNCHRREAQILCSDDVVDLIHRLTDLRGFMHQSSSKKSSGCLLSVIYQTWFITLLNPCNLLDFFFFFLRLCAVEILRYFRKISFTSVQSVPNSAFTDFYVVVTLQPISSSEKLIQVL